MEKMVMVMVIVMVVVKVMAILLSSLLSREESSRGGGRGGRVHPQAFIVTVARKWRGEVLNWGMGRLSPCRWAQRRAVWRCPGPTNPSAKEKISHKVKKKQRRR
jgi:hypothetical protein